VLGPHAVGARDLPPGPLAPLGRVLAGRIGRFPVPLPVAVPVMPLQFVHEEDLGRVLLQCVLGAGPPGAYNIAADGILTTADVAREFGLIPLPLPAGPAHLAARAVASLPFLPPAAQWVEAASHPVIMDTTRAKRELGWVPRSPPSRPCGTPSAPGRPALRTRCSAPLRTGWRSSLRTPGPCGPATMLRVSRRCSSAGRAAVL